MSAEPRWCETCGKQGYRSFGAASANASWMSGKQDMPLRVYHSETCCFWHITKKVDLTYGGAA